MDFAKVSSFSSYGWLTLTAVLDFSENKKLLMGRLLGTSALGLYHSTALRCVDNSRKSLSEMLHAFVHGHAHQTHLDLVVSTLLFSG